MLGTGQEARQGADRADSGRGGFPVQGACPFTERQERFRFLCEDYEFLERPGRRGRHGRKACMPCSKALLPAGRNAQEIRVGRFVADAVTGDSFHPRDQSRDPLRPLRKKLAVFLERYEVQSSTPPTAPAGCAASIRRWRAAAPRGAAGRPESAWKLFYALPAIREYLDRPRPCIFLVPVLRHLRPDGGAAQEGQSRQGHRCAGL